MRNIAKKIILLSIALLLFAPVARLHAEDQPDLLGTSSKRLVDVRRPSKAQLCKSTGQDTP